MVVVSTVVAASVVELTEGVTGDSLVVTNSFTVVCPSLVPTVIGVSVSAGGGRPCLQTGRGVFVHGVAGRRSDCAMWLTVSGVAGT